MSTSFASRSQTRPDWRAHQLIVRLFNLVIAVAALWLLAVNLAFYIAVGREFAPELASTIGRVLTRGG